MAWHFAYFTICGLALCSPQRRYTLYRCMYSWVPFSRHCHLRAQQTALAQRISSGCERKSLPLCTHAAVFDLKFDLFSESSHCCHEIFPNFVVEYPQILIYLVKFDHFNAHFRLLWVIQAGLLHLDSFNHRISD